MNESKVTDDMKVKSIGWYYISINSIWWSDEKKKQTAERNNRKSKIRCISRKKIERQFNWRQKVSFNESIELITNLKSLISIFNLCFADSSIKTVVHHNIFFFTRISHLLCFALINARLHMKGRNVFRFYVFYLLLLCIVSFCLSQTLLSDLNKYWDVQIECEIWKVLSNDSN